jgi:hypothetical protein
MDSANYSLLADYRRSVFESHAIFALKRYLNPLWQALSRRHISAKLQAPGKRLILVVDGRPSALLRFCVLNSLVMTGFKYRCNVYTDGSSVGDMRALFDDMVDFVNVIDLSVYGISHLTRSVYNSLLKTSQFWSAIPASSVLLTQPDALLIEPFSDEFFKYDFVGAPWSPNRVFSASFPEYASGELSEYTEIWQNIVMNPNLKLPVRIGNGGHSIRGISFMVAISSLGGSPEDEPEDIFFAKNIQSYSGCFPSALEAKRFSCETSYSYAYGSHASHLYIESFYQSEIYERHIKHLAGLYLANCV